MNKAVYAAGALCWRLIEGKVHVLVIHRTAYGDVTIPKGKVDPGETLPQTAVREIGEETGLSVNLGVPLGMSRYLLPSGKTKVVHYWAAFVSDEAIRTSQFRPNREVAAIEWVTLKKARTYLTYGHDVEIVDVFDKLVAEGVTHTFSITVLRHAKAASASAGDGTDAGRPLTPRGLDQAQAVVPMIAAFGPRKIVTSDALRCVTTVAPLAAATSITPKRSGKISQDAFEEDRADPRSIIGKRVSAGKNAVICSHLPLVPELLREIALATGSVTGSYIRSAADLAPGDFSVVHLSATNPSSGIISIETHPNPV
ncbi:8-oxo-dGTP diphosphatase [Mycetocola sp. BIGb0189]|uniref:NUDIX hydrolase n=1 Tax=Mycetocola sp. BIGb0189 TaxID=2940604 RepID=UPI0021693A38|nr:NUDIX hydrolase [Mycetocola sp. BIGb0189]MCS4277760.1 8-oxo-dGTP diphosphatase [Mycetocola sp. BIGb0189]